MLHCSKTTPSHRLKINLKPGSLAGGMTVKLACILLVTIALILNYKANSQPVDGDNDAKQQPAIATTTTTNPSVQTTIQPFINQPQTTSIPTSVKSTTTKADSNFTRLPKPADDREQYDTNKELIDYGNTFMESLRFVQTEKLAGSEAAAQKRVEEMLAKHHNYEEMYQYLLELSRQYPDITRLYSVGKSVEGRKLWVLEVTEEPGKHKLLKPEVKYVANMHGNEVVGRELLLQLARLLVENYKAALEEPVGDTKPTGPKFVKKLLMATRIHLMPSMNPDGYERSNVSCTYEAPSKRGRLNANNVDLNRNFPDPLVNSTKDPGTQPEVEAIMKWSKEIPFVLSANFHSGALVVSIPYDGGLNTSAISEIRHSPDDDLFTHLARTYSYSHYNMWEGKECYDRCTTYHPEVFPDGITHGSEWYNLYGGMQDWLYQNTNSLDTTIEIGCNQYPEAQTLPQYWDYNKRALLNYIKQAHRGVKGTISDAITNVLLQNVTVHVVDRAEHNITSTSFGDYFRLLMPGFYEIVFELKNYIPQRVTLSIDNTMAQIVNIKLQPIGMSHSLGQNEGSTALLPPIQQTNLGPQVDGNKEESGDDHSLVVATLVMTIIIVLILLAMAGAYVIQRRRFSRSQSVSMELQPTSRSTGASTGVSLPGRSSGSSTNQHLST